MVLPIYRCKTFLVSTVCLFLIWDWERLQGGFSHLDNRNRNGYSLLVCLGLSPLLLNVSRVSDVPRESYRAVIDLLVCLIFFTSFCCSPLVPLLRRLVLFVKIVSKHRAIATGYSMVISYLETTKHSMSSPKY